MNPGIVINKNLKVIQAVSQFPIMPQYKNFSKIATTDGQTEFTLDDYPVLTGIVFVNVNGVAQDPLNGDYTVTGNLLTIPYGLYSGDKVSGFYQVMSPAINAYSLNFSSYYELVNTPGKTVFTLSFQPSPIVYVTVNGLVLDNLSYSLSGYTLTLNVGLNVSDRLYVVGINN